MSSVAVLAACATVVMMYVKFPIVPGAPFLKYDPSDAITLLAALWWGPASGVAAVALKDLLLWLLRDGNPLGPLADAIAAGTFVACTAAVYRRLQPSG
ncbi:MAG TPA: ECF transporter S component, partial [Limnochordales bacterium]